MADEEQDRLNFYSKYTRVKGKQEIDTLYSLIDNNKPTEIHIVNVLLMRQERERRAQQDQKYKNSKLIIPKQIIGKQNEENYDGEYDQINDKLQKLKRLERQFHQEMDRRERNLKKKRQRKEQQRKQQQKYRDHLINVVDFKPSNEFSPKSSQLKSKKNGSLMHEIVVDNQELDFEDYYRQVPEIPIYRSYIPNTQSKKQIIQKFKEHRNGQAYVESVDEEGDKRADSVVIGRMNTKCQNIGKIAQDEVQVEKRVEVQLTHSQSENVFNQKRLDNKQFNIDENKGSERRISQEMMQSVCQEYSPARHLNSIQQNIYLNSASKSIQKSVQPQQEEPEMNYKSEQGEKYQQLDSEDNQNQENNGISGEQIHEDYTSEPTNIAYANNHTGTQEGQSLRQEIQDRVGPIINKSDYKQQNYNNVSVQPSVFHSQTLPSSKIDKPREVQSLVSDSLDYHPLEQPNGLQVGQKLFENKKSSFKKLMAQNRANLVPRMAISTILNEHINEALIDFKLIAHPTVTPLHQSIISSQNPTPLSPPSKKKRINFKQKIVEQQINKSYSREGRPVFERDQSKVQKNRGLLLNFFAQN